MCVLVFGGWWSLWVKTEILRARVNLDSFVPAANSLIDSPRETCFPDSGADRAWISLSISLILRGLIVKFEMPIRRVSVNMSAFWLQSLEFGDMDWGVACTQVGFVLWARMRSSWQWIPGEVRLWAMRGETGGRETERGTRRPLFTSRSKRWRLTRN